MGVSVSASKAGIANQLFYLPAIYAGSEDLNLGPQACVQVL